ncbi:MAG: hypothetical protein ACRDUV_18305 [Pseudonocardiaceae bacterium]
MYTVETDGPAKHQVDALPAEALIAYAELRVVLETAPWSGRPYHRHNPQGAVRTCSFGTHGMVVYLILEDQRRVDVLLVQWVG